MKNVVEHAAAVVAAGKKIDNLKEAVLLAKEGMLRRLELYDYGPTSRSQKIELTRDECLKITRKRLRAARAEFRELTGDSK